MGSNGRSRPEFSTTAHGLAWWESIKPDKFRNRTSAAIAKEMMSIRKRTPALQRIFRFSAKCCSCRLKRTMIRHAALSLTKAATSLGMHSTAASACLIAAASASLLNLKKRDVLYRCWRQHAADRAAIATSSNRSGQGGGHRSSE